MATIPLTGNPSAVAIEQAGAAAIELNLYSVPSDTNRSSAELEAEQIAIVRQVYSATRLPVAVKLSPWYTALASMARQLQLAGAGALVLYQPVPTT